MNTNNHKHCELQACITSSKRTICPFLDESVCLIDEAQLELLTNLEVEHSFLVDFEWQEELQPGQLFQQDELGITLDLLEVEIEELVYSSEDIGRMTWSADRELTFHLQKEQHSHNWSE